MWISPYEDDIVNDGDEGSGSGFCTNMWGTL